MAWRNRDKYVREWLQEFRDHLKPLFGDKVAHMPTVKLVEIDDDAVRKALTPLYGENPKLASRVRAKLETVLGYAIAHGMRENRHNPATWDGVLEHPFSAAGTAPQHLAALSYDDAGVFMHRLRQDMTVAARCLEFIVLTATRQNEALAADWSEIDWANRVWRIPASRMKSGKPHDVPLSCQALALCMASGARALA